MLTKSAIIQIVGTGNKIRIGDECDFKYTTVQIFGNKG